MKSWGIAIVFGLLFSVTSMIRAQDVVVTVTGTTPVSCGSGSDGSITVEVTGGVGQYSYLLLRSTFPVEFVGPIASNTYTFSGLIKFTNYMIIVSDEDLVTLDGYGWATVDGPNPISITSAASTDITCNGANDGTITVSATGEGGNYIFDLTGTEVRTNETGIFTGLQAGSDYVVTVSDKDGCPSTDATAMMTINNPPSISISQDGATNIACFGDNTGSISITPSGGTPGGAGTGYTYAWTGPNGYTSSLEDIMGLEAGGYSVTVFDGNMCSANLGPINLTQPAELTAVLTSTTDVTCNGGNDGTASMTPGGGTGGYAFSWDGQFTGLISTDQNPTNLVADTYDFTLFDNGGCSKTFTDFAIINEPAPISVTVVSTTDVSCAGGSDGSAEITPAGGTSPYTFLWTGAVSGYSSTEEDPTGMPADDYSLTITDVTGICNQSFPSVLTIGEPTPLSVILAGTTEVSCPGGADGTASIDVSGGTPVYTFNWTGDLSGYTSSVEDPMDMVADTYDLTVTDNNGCIQVYNNLATIGEPAVITANVDNITDVNCNGDATGAIDIMPAGGTSPYTFLWSGPGGFSSTDEDLSGLEAGDYSLTITDSKSCIQDLVNLASVGTNTSITAIFSVTNVTCNGAGNGAINASVSGGTPNYTYSWTGPGGFTAFTEDIAGLEPGTYTLTVTDNLGCVEVLPGQVVTEPAPITVNVVITHIDCFGDADGAVDLTPGGGVAPYTFAWTGPGAFSANTEDISGLGPGTYNVTVTDANLCSIPFTAIAKVNESPEIQASATSTDITCNGLADGTIDLTVSGGVSPYGFYWAGPGGFSSTDEDLTGLEAGTYDVTVTDANGCVVAFPAVAIISEPSVISAAYVSQVDILCNGAATGSIEISVSGGIAPLSFDWTDAGGITVSTDEDPSGLTAGTYSLNVTDNNGCAVPYPDMATLTEPPAIGVSLTASDISCFGYGDGAITVNASGGIAPLQYSINGDNDPDYQAGNIFSTLGPGLYTLWVRDANLCVVTDTISVYEPAEILIGNEQVDGQNLCFGDSSVSITIENVTGGVAPYEYSINNGVDFSSSNFFGSLPEGNYQTVVRDASGCPVTGELHVVSQPPVLSIGPYLQDDITTCSGYTEGRIQITAAGGTPGYTYLLNDTLSNTSGDFQNLAAGTFKITLSDLNGCSLDTTVVISEPPPIVVDNLSETDVSGCAGNANGEISVSGSGGTGTIVFSLDGGPFQGGLFSGLSAATYNLTLGDDNGCTLDTSAVINEPAPLSISAELITPIICNGDENGSIEIQVAGGTSPYEFTLNPGAIVNSTGIFGGLAPGTYTVSVNDTPGCGPVLSNPLTLTDPPELLADSVRVTGISCYGADDGSLEIFGSGGTPPYEYSIDGMTSWNPDSVFTGLGPLTCNVHIRDASLCTVFAGQFILTEPPAMNLSVVTTDITLCAGDTTGMIVATGSGGTGLLGYSIDGTAFQDSGRFINLAAGDYTVTLLDETGCTVTLDTILLEPEPLSSNIQKTDATFGNLGSLTFTSTTGGTPPYSFTIGGPSGTFTSDTVYTGLEPDVYNAIVLDQNGCTYDSTIPILDVVPLDVVVNVSHVSCFGAQDGVIEFVPQDAEGAVEFSIDSGLNFVSGALFENLAGNTTYYLVAQDAAGKVFTDSVVINEPAALSVTWIVSLAKCNAFSETGSIELDVSGGTMPYMFAWSDGESVEDRPALGAGEYVVRTTDDNDCSRMDTIFVSSLVTVEAYAGRDTIICYGDSMQLTGLGGNIPSWSPVDFLSDPDISDPVVQGLTETTSYILTISEEQSGFGCYNSDTVLISVFPMTGLTASEDTFVVLGTSAYLEAFGGPFSDYRWEPGTGLDNSTIPDPVATPQQTTVYIIYATNDYGCEESDSVMIEVIENIRAYNVFTPNDDGINDFFDIENAERFPEMVVEVYSRWGDLLFQARGYDDASRWDGRARNRNVPMGTYYYVIIPYKGASPITGNVTIIR